MLVREAHIRIHETISLMEHPQGACISKIVDAVGSCVSSLGGSKDEWISVSLAHLNSLDPLAQIASLS